MTQLCLDHVLAYTGASTVEDALASYRAGGFAPLPRTVRHAPGLRNGFIGLGPEYLELLWVDDERAFASAGPWRQVQRRAHRPFALALRTDDLEGVRAAWRGRGIDVGTASDGAAWSFIHLPPKTLPGAPCFVLRYHTVDEAVRGRLR